MRMPYTAPDAPEMPMISRRGEMFVILPPLDATERIVVESYQAASVGWVELLRNPSWAFPSGEVGDGFRLSSPSGRLKAGPGGSTHPTGFVGQKSTDQHTHGVRRECACQRLFVGRHIGARGGFNRGCVFRCQSGRERKHRLLLQPLGFKFDRLDPGAK